MAQTITVKAAKAALNNLSKLKPANEKYDDDLEMSVKEAVFFMAPDLIQHAKRGFTSKELSIGLAQGNIDIKPGTLNRYLNEYLVAKQALEKSEAVTKNNEVEDKKTDAKVSESAEPVSRPKAASDTQRPERQNTAMPSGKERGGFENPKPAAGDPNPGLTAGGGKSDWSRLAESTTASKTA